MRRQRKNERNEETEKSRKEESGKKRSRRPRRKAIEESRARNQPGGGPNRPIMVARRQDEFGLTTSQCWTSSGSDQPTPGRIRLTTSERRNQIRPTTSRRRNQIRPTPSRRRDQIRLTTQRTPGPNPHSPADAHTGRRSGPVDDSLGDIVINIVYAPNCPYNFQDLKVGPTVRNRAGLTFRWTGNICAGRRKKGATSACEPNAPACGGGQPVCADICPVLPPVKVAPPAELPKPVGRRCPLSRRRRPTRCLAHT